ncbi:MAG TPA: protein kinase [Polyangia bacterium]|nr:protein kinase [Polyangia bacterium]
MTEERPASTAPGEILGGKYRLIQVIGEGAMGRVYEAQHAVVGRRFAVKVLQAQLAREPALLERFHREARAAGALESENLASIVDFGHTRDGLPYIVMELLVGEDLSKLIEREGPLPVPRVVSLGVQTCRGLAAAHNAGIVHRDLKPANLFVTRRGDGSDLVKILDFGIAKLESAAEAQLLDLTQTGSTMGTPLYMSPEQARGEKELDHRADIYATAVILYEALSGRMPHEGDSYNALLHHILTQPAPPLTALRPDLPAPVAAAIHAALSPNRDERPQSAMELARALSGYADVTPPFLRRSPTAVMPAATTMLLQAEPAPSPEPRPRLADTARPAPRRRWPIGVAVGSAVSLAAVVAILIAVLTPTRQPRPAPAPGASTEPAIPAQQSAARPPEEPAPQTETVVAPPAPTADRPPPVEAAPSPPTAAEDKPPPPPARRKPATRRAAEHRPPKPKFDDANPYK